MIAYFFIAISLLGLSLTLGLNPPLQRVNRPIAYFIIVPIGIFALWRLAGTDYHIYSEHFARISRSSENIFEANGGSWEKGFVALAGVFSGLGLPYNALMVSAISIGLFICFFVASRNVPNTTAFAFALFCLCFLFISFIRQDLAAALAFLSFHFLIQGKTRLFFVAAILAITIHLSAGLIVGAIILMNEWRRGRLFRKSTLKVVAAFAVIAGLIGYFLVDFVHIDNQISVYAAEGFVQGVVDEQTSAVRNSFKFVFYIVFTAVFRHYYPKQSRANDALSFSLGIVCYFSIFGIVLSQITPVFSRLSLYLFPFIALIYGGMFQRKSHSSLTCIFIGSLLLLIHLLIAFVPLAEWM